MNEEKEAIYNRLVICWFKAALGGAPEARSIKTHRLKRMKELYPRQYTEARNELFKSTNKESQREKILASMRQVHAMSNQETASLDVTNRARSSTTSGKCVRDIDIQSSTSTDGEHNK